MLDENVNHSLAEPATHAASSYAAIRRQTTELCKTLEIEDYGPQSMPDASPAKWHLAHTTWFFERFVLQRQARPYRQFHPQFDFMFNSYYESVGPQQPRALRGLLSRPTVAEVYRYREHVDAHMQELLAAESRLSRDIRQTIEIGVNHEQQHQELLLTDIKHLLFANPLRPAYRRAAHSPSRDPQGERKLGSATGASAAPMTDATQLRWRHYAAGEHQIGADGSGQFCFDNETPRHRCYTGAVALADRLVSNGEFREFVRADGYRRASLWLSDGWQLVQSQNWQRPLYWGEDLQSEFTLAGNAPLEADAPVCHISYYEADAYARWAGARLATEAEWERAAASEPLAGNFLESGTLHPSAPTALGRAPATPAAHAVGPSGPTAPLTASGGMRQLYGDVWEWTASAYLPYPGFRPWPDTLGEYNGKFMANQFVLRGGSCATPRSHIRSTYRNFFYPGSRWQFSGIRLAQDA
jgi:ergothioneine biosynthesis protein EgtB